MTAIVVLLYFNHSLFEKKVKLHNTSRKPRPCKLHCNSHNPLVILEIFTKIVINISYKIKMFLAKDSLAGNVSAYECFFLC